MKCPHCEAENPEGKRYCADCGSPLAPKVESLRDLIRAQVEESVHHNFKDHRVVEVETAEAIASRILRWAKLYYAFPAAVLAIILGVFGIRDYITFRSTIHRATNELNPKLDRAVRGADTATNKAQEAEQKAGEASKSIDTAVAQMNSQLKSIQQLSEKVSGLEQRTESKMTSAGNKIEGRVVELNSMVDAANKEIAAQQHKLTSTNELVTALFSKGETELFFPTQTSAKVFVLPQQPKGARVYMLLKSAPIFQTIQLQYHIFTQPKYSYFQSGNILMFNWADPVESLKQYPLAVSYVPDPSYKRQVYSSLSFHDGHVFADNTQLP